MGLCISVGIKAYVKINDSEDFAFYLKVFEEINKVLKENGLPEYHEPEDLPEMVMIDEQPSVAYYNSFSYSFIHYLRRFYARSVADPDWIPTLVAEGENPWEDEAVIDELAMLSSHLLCHSDCEGYYLPVDFDEVIFDFDKVIFDEEGEDRIPGNMLGSSYALLKELKFIADKLKINLDEHGVILNLSDIHVEINNETGFWIEKIVWLVLYESSLLSIKYNTAIVFQ